MRVLGIEHIRNNLVGDAEKRGISGGQKKRVNIGVELAAMPAIIFMDEPTSGLDGAATIELARCLGQLRQSGLTIICVIHQPRLAVYEEFTHLLLLGKGGQQVYCGRGELIEEYFTSLGFRLPDRENPADWLIDVVCGLSPRYNDDGSIDEGFKAPADLFTAWAAMKGSRLRRRPRVFAASRRQTCAVPACPTPKPPCSPPHPSPPPNPPPPQRPPPYLPPPPRSHPRCCRRHRAPRSTDCAATRPAPEQTYYTCGRSSDSRHGTRSDHMPNPLRPRRRLRSMSAEVRRFRPFPAPLPTPHPAPQPPPFPRPPAPHPSPHTPSTRCTNRARWRGTTTIS